MKRLIALTSATGLLAAIALVVLVLPAWTRAHAGGSAAWGGGPTRLVVAAGMLVAGVVLVAAAIVVARGEDRRASRDEAPRRVTAGSSERGAAPAGRTSQKAA